jgi:sarcosine oxidase subunit beta
MHYDLAVESALAWASYPYFASWAELVGAGDPGFVNCGFLQLADEHDGEALRLNVAEQQALGIATSLVTPADIAQLVPGIVLDGLVAGAWEPLSGYADPSGTAGGLIAAAARLGATLSMGVRASAILTAGGRVTGLATDAGDIAAPLVVVAAGAWSATLAATAGLALPVEPWRHDTAYFGLPSERPSAFPIVLDRPGAVYFRPEGRDLMLAGLETGNDVGGSPDRAVEIDDPNFVVDVVERLCSRVPWMASGDFRTSHGGQDGITPDQRAILGPAGVEGPSGLWLACGFSGTGFKTAPAVGASMTEWILDGRPATVDITPFSLSRYAAGQLLEGEHPYGPLWN